MKKLADFKNLTKAEGDLVKWLQAGNREILKLPQNNLDVSCDAVTLRPTFIRYLALGGCDACRLPETGLRVQGAVIKSKDRSSESNHGLDLEGVTLPGDLILLKCHFPDSVILKSAKIRNLSLQESLLEGKLDADQIVADGDIVLEAADIRDGLLLRGANILGDLNCTSIELTHKNESSDDRAGSNNRQHALSGNRLAVNGSAFFQEAEVTGEIQLKSAKIENDLFFDGATLGPTSATLEDDSSDNWALRLNRAEIKGTLYFRKHKSRKKPAQKALRLRGIVDLRGATLGALNDNKECWPDEILLNGCTYGSLMGQDVPLSSKDRKEWLNKHDRRFYDNEFRPGPYEHCAKVLREMGHGTDANIIQIEKECLLRKTQRTSHCVTGVTLFECYYKSVWSWFLYHTVRYGWEPLRAFIWLALLWFIGLVVFFFVAHNNAMIPKHIDTHIQTSWIECSEGGRLRLKSYKKQMDCFHAQSAGKTFPSFNPFIYSADTLFPVVSLEMQSYWLPDDTEPFGKYARWYLWFHIAAGWALTLLAVAGFSGLIKTDNTK